MVGHFAKAERIIVYCSAKSDFLAPPKECIEEDAHDLKQPLFCLSYTTLVCSKAPKQKPSTDNADVTCSDKCRQRTELKQRLGSFCSSDNNNKENKNRPSRL